MAKFKILADMMIIYKGQIVSLKAGEFATDDKEFAELLKAERHVEAVAAKASKKSEPA